MKTSLMPKVLLSGVMTALLVGCGGSGEKSWSPTMENPPERDFKVGKAMFVEDMKPDDVIVAVNGITLTRADFDVHIKRYKWFLDRQRMADVQKQNAMYRSYGRGFVSRFINTAVVLKEARSSALLDAATIRREVENSVELTLKRNNLDRETYDAKVPGGIKAMQVSLEEALWCHVYMTNNIVVDPSIDATLVSNILAKIDEENKVISASNDVIRARLAEARRRIVEGGEEFGKVADEICEDDQMTKDGTGYYGMFGEGTIQDEAVRKALFALSEGEVSEILEEDDGYSLYKILKRDDARFDRGQIVEDAKVDLARIWVVKHDLVVPAFSSDPVEDMRRQDFDEKAAKLTASLREKAKIVYPHGTNFWKTAQKSVRK